MLKELRHKEFKNGIVYALETEDGFPLEVTDTFLPNYTKDAINQNENVLHDYVLGDRTNRWMIGVSCMSGCNVGCKFCATGQLKKFRKLSAEEIVKQVEFILSKNSSYKFGESFENKINYTRMGEPFFNLDEVRKYNPDIDEWIASHSWCVTTIPDFDGEVNYYVDKQGDAHIVGIGNINLFTTQTSL